MTSAAVIAVAADGRREPVHLAGEINRGGASGRIDAIDGDPDRVAKIYHDPAKAAAARDRLVAMLARPPNLKPPRLNGVDYVQLAWPDALIEDAAGRLLGFRMPRVALDRAAPLECLLHPAQRRADKLPEDYGLRVFAAANLASVVAELHRLGHYVIDLKPLNFYVYREPMFIAVLDCDGFSIAGPQRRFPAGHFSDEYRCPESAGRRPGDLGEEQDLFAMAVVIFQLLNDGIHPFDGHPAPGASVPSSHQEKINAGLYPYGRRRNPPLLPHALSLYASLEDETQGLFDRAFTAASSRPSAAEWRDHLRRLIEGHVLVRCTKKGDHAHFGKGCGLCMKEAAVRAAASRPSVVPRARHGAPAVLGRRSRPAISPAAQPAPLAHARSAGSVAARPAAVSAGAVGGLAAALVTATKAGIVGGAIGLAAVLLALPLLTAAEALLLTMIVMLAIGVWVDERRGHGRYRGLTAALISLVPTWATFPELYTAALRLPAPAALAATAALASLVPGFTFHYLVARRQRVARRWSSTVRRGAVGAAVIAGLVALQVAATVALGLVEAGPRADDRPALPPSVVAAVGRAKQSIAEAVDRVRQSMPPR